MCWRSQTSHIHLMFLSALQKQEYSERVIWRKNTLSSINIFTQPGKHVKQAETFKGSGGMPSPTTINVRVRNQQNEECIAVLPKYATRTVENTVYSDGMNMRYLDVHLECNIFPIFQFPWGSPMLIIPFDIRQQHSAALMTSHNNVFRICPIMSPLIMLILRK
ncbi:hypothetical protein LOAG_04379 [Loa loa]|uniref:Uncharacterized protein n=1 Tax=Loa loa TaxID=7209 RepID=A0A1S0U3Y0_LOALO|nr:hypothetical protein LOAG_04379 [Loa loa]EFO24102.1 hypothetical protein LOAG_04379 [Loa loa]